MKRCPRCGEEKPLDDFYNNRYTKDGKSSACKICHTEQARSSTKKWMSNHKERMRELDRNRYARNPSKKTDYIKRWRTSNQDKISSAYRMWVSEHPESIKEYGRTRRARKKGNGGKITAFEWLGILKKYGDKCLNPNCPDPSQPVTMDHVIPLKLGGAHSAENVQPLCKLCNDKKWINVIDYRMGITI